MFGRIDFFTSSKMGFIVFEICPVNVGLSKEEKRRILMNVEATVRNSFGIEE